MVLNYIWIAFFVVAFIVALSRLIFLGDFETFNATVNSTFASARSGFEISIGLTGVLTLWMGLMKIGEQGGVIQLFSRAINPLFSRLFPDIPKNHPAGGSILLNLSANILGLDNAATPAGLQAMKELQEINPDKSKASNPMMMFLVMNASGLTLIPVSVMTIRAQMGAANPADVFVPIMIATFVSTMIGVLAVCIKQKINILDKVILGTFGSAAILIGGVIWAFSSMGPEKAQQIASVIASIILFSVILFFILSGVRKKINVYDAFIEGAKDGFSTAVRIIPYLIAILVAVGMFRASGTMDFIFDGLKSFVVFTGFDSRWVDAMPTALMKPLSGSGARGMMAETITVFGVDSFAGRLASIFQASTDTTFFVVAVYYGSVGIKNSRYTVPYALLADLVGVVTAIWIAYIFFS
ncbi:MULTISPECIES: nucleoside recognition domain-containing protein [unclassified Dysgonomonas]|uniref:nucleoside recognition domain-containing protein n=1 Tax=unclassified Dysgonomonas TaxID=2630389 RepID=UPI0006829D9D|nr:MULTISPECIES: spore maturation protein [unclassified Dysgonomonas]MBD8349055.1 spore maturation protein [Dysgonomonas sp. HGC4]MBF0576516.1 spore maturation protein [Dysgonomonas sp. GY617]